MYHYFFIHSSLDGHVGCFHFLAIVNSATMNSGIHVSFSILVCSGYMPRSGIAEPYGGFIPSCQRNLHTVFHSCCINLHSHQQCKSIPFSPHPLQHLQTFQRWPFWPVWGSISHCSFDVHFSNNEWYWASFHVFVSHLNDSLEKCLFRSFPHFLIGLSVFLALSCMSCLYFGN